MILKLLVRKRTLWLPTWLGLLLISVVGFAPLLTWILIGEGVLAADRDVAKELLVVDGWIQEEPIQAAAAEFLRGEYPYVVATGGINGEKWSKFRWSNAEIARKGLQRGGVPPAKIIFAQAPDTTANRTFSTAVTVKQALNAKGLAPKSVVVYSRGAHAFRSRMIFQKILGPAVQVGVISWKPPGSESARWWHDSSRAEEFLKETCACVWEWAFDSGRKL